VVSDNESCIEFWRNARGKVDKFKKLDDQALVFGAWTRGFGHEYEVLPVVTDEEVLRFEDKHQLVLPLEYSTYLRTFGAGGAGPYYGIADFRQYVSAGSYDDTFPYTEAIEYDEMDDDQPIWNYPGLAWLGTAGCGADFLMEFRGPSPGQIWCDWSQQCSVVGTLIEFYQKWLDKVETGLERFHRLRSLSNASPVPSFDALLVHMRCGYREITREDGNSQMPEDQIALYFDDTPGRVLLNRRRDIQQFVITDVGQIS